MQRDGADQGLRWQMTGRGGGNSGNIIGVVQHMCSCKDAAVGCQLDAGRQHVHAMLYVLDWKVLLLCMVMCRLGKSLA
jgi:hypothetical protein